MKRKKLFIRPKLNNQKGDLNKQWFIYYSVLNPKNGKMIRYRHYDGFTGLKTSEEKTEHGETLIREYNAKLEQGWSPLLDNQHAVYDDQLQYAHLADIYGIQKSSNYTVRYYSSKYLNSLSGLDETGTIPTYRSKLRVFNNWLDANGYSQYDVTAITNKVILDFFNFLIEIRHLSDHSIKSYRHIIHALFNYIIKHNDNIYQTPVHDIPKSRFMCDNSPSPIHPTDIPILLGEIKKYSQLYLFIQFEYYCFIRPKELRFAKIKDIDFGRGRMDVSKSRSKTNMERKPIIPDIFLNKLKQEWGLHKYPRDMYIFGKNGTPGIDPVGKNTMIYRYNKIRDELNMPKEYTLYSWKHTGTLAADSVGVPMRHIQHQAGHTSIRTTEIYMKKKRGFNSEEIRTLFPEL